ncbi:MAG TPA: PilZ domain-containing protein [Candidatus Sulfotelmatobacter sp.]|nr:PilZ domain-containing protein [Candidatus Sulfotelmatobacter sp.]
MIHQSHRFYIIVPVRYTTATPPGTPVSTGWTRNLSESGACVELPERLQPGVRITLDFQTEGGPMRMVGMIIWTDPSSQPGAGSLHGLQFSAASDDRERLRGWIHSRPGPPARIVASLPAQCRRLDGVSPVLEGWTSDLGAGGCALFLPEPLPVGTLMDVFLTTPAGEVPTQGVVVWEGGRRAAPGKLIEHGFRFTKLPAEREGLLGEVLDAILATRAMSSTAEQP